MNVEINHNTGKLIEMLNINKKEFESKLFNIFMKVNLGIKGLSEAPELMQKSLTDNEILFMAVSDFIKRLIEND